MALKKNNTPQAAAIVAPSQSKTDQTAKPKQDPQSAKTEKPKYLVKLLKAQQIQDPGTKVMLKQNVMVPVPSISGWVKFQETVGFLEIIEL
jgi:hypothetical protein